MIAFIDEGHQYVSVSPELEGVKWISGTKFASMFHDEFNAVLGAAKASQNKRSKWFGMSPDEIQEIWKRESKRSTDTGTAHHLAMEAKYLAMETMDLFGKTLKIYHPTYDDAGRKLSPDQAFPEGVHPEALLYYRLTDGLGICGQSDTVAICEQLANISDHKTNKEMKTQGYYDKWSGKTSMMHWPFQFLEDCDFSKYVIQLNFYMYILLMNNPGFRPGKMVLRHIGFKVESEDEFGFPTHVFENGLPVVERVQKYDVPLIPMKTMGKAINHLIEYYDGARS